MNSSGEKRMEAARKPRYDQRLVSDPIPATLPVEQRNKVDNPAGREMYRQIIEAGQPVMDRFIGDFRDAGR